LAQHQNGITGDRATCHQVSSRGHTMFTCPHQFHKNSSHLTWFFRIFFPLITSG